MSTCIEWSRGRTAKGYGVKWINGKAVYAHRFAWERANGPIPDGMMVCHTCDNPPCVNPTHLFLGTNSDNIKDAVAKGRHFTPWSGVTECIHGHEFTEENTRSYMRNGTMRRECRTCRRKRDRESKARSRT